MPFRKLNEKVKYSFKSL